LVEDSEDDVFFIARAFQAVGLISPLARACNGQDAIDYLSGKNSYTDRLKFPFPALVLLDVKMPFMSGFDVLHWLRQQPMLATLPVIIFTTSNQERDVERAYALGANAYLVKPARLEDCTTLAGLIKQFWLEANIPPPVPFNPAEGAENENPPAASAKEHSRKE
jgi:CheY-like chemotaxis protein